MTSQQSDRRGVVKRVSFAIYDDQWDAMVELAGEHGSVSSVARDALDIGIKALRRAAIRKAEGKE